MAATVSDGERLPPVSVGFAPPPPPENAAPELEAAAEPREADTDADVIVDNVVCVVDGLEVECNNEVVFVMVCESEEVKALLERGTIFVSNRRDQKGRYILVVELKLAEALDNRTEAVIAEVGKVDGDDESQLEFPCSDTSALDVGKDIDVLDGDGLGNGVEGGETTSCELEPGSCIDNDWPVLGNGIVPPFGVGVGIDGSDGDDSAGGGVGVILGALIVGAPLRKDGTVRGPIGRSTTVGLVGKEGRLASPNVFPFSSATIMFRADWITVWTAGGSCGSICLRISQCSPDGNFECDVVESLPGSSPLFWIVFAVSSPFSSRLCGGFDNRLADFELSEIPNLPMCLECFPIHTG